MAVDIPAPASSVYTNMNVLNNDIRDILVDPVSSDGADGARISKAVFLRAFARAVKYALERVRGYKAWININVVSGTYEYTLSDSGAVLQVLEVLYNAEPICQITQEEMNQRRYDGIESVVDKYSLTPAPVTKIQLNATPDTNITAGLKVYALQYPTAPTDITGQTSPLPSYYDNYLINKTAMLLFKAYQDNEEAKAYNELAEADLRNVMAIDSLAIDGRITPAFI